MIATTLSHPRSTQRPRQLSRQTPVRSATQYSFLVIGYGNELRGDDAVGAQVAKTIANWHLPGVKAIVAHQLLPELATEIAKVNYVIFVDAYGEKSCARTAQLSPILAKPSSSANGSSTAITHAHSAQELLFLTQKIYEHAPQAWLLQVPTERFDFGEQLSSTAQRGIDQAVQTIERFLINYQIPYSFAL